MNLLKSRAYILLALGISLAVASAQPNDDKSKDKNSSGDKGSRSYSPSGSSGKRYDSGSQSAPGRGPSRSYSDSPNSRRDNSYSSRDSKGNGDSESNQKRGNSDSSSNQKNRDTNEKSDRSVNSGQNPGRHLGESKDSGTSASSNDRKNGGDSKQTNERSNSTRPTATDKSGNSRPTTASTPKPTLQTKQVANGEERRTASGQLREKVERKSDGEHTKYVAPTGRVQKEVIQKPNGAKETVNYAADGRVQKTTVVAKDGARETTAVQYGRNGKERATETVKVDARGKEVSKTVVVKQNTTIIKNTTIVHNTTIVRNYDRARYGFVYRPVYVVHSPVFVSWYDPYWYGPRGVWVVHPFHYSWGWDDYGWYRWHRSYWHCYDVYPTPAYWMTDWLIAGYVADRYEAAVSVDQAREDARLAREDAERSADAARRAREDAEIAEAKAAQSEAEARAAKADAALARAEAQEAQMKSKGEQPNAKAAPIDPETKEALRVQIENEVAQKKAYADEVAKGGNPVPPDVSKCLADPKHVYPVSSSINVVSAKDQSPAGALTEGDLLKLEPGQEDVLKNADENTFVTMRVMSSKGEEGEATAGTLISLPIKTLQDFDSEFRAKIDLGLAEADKNKDQFKTGGTKAGGG
jgi:hypothetical protein